MLILNGRLIGYDFDSERFEVDRMWERGELICDYPISHSSRPLIKSFFSDEELKIIKQRITEKKNESTDLTIKKQQKGN